MQAEIGIMGNGRNLYANSPRGTITYERLMHIYTYHQLAAIAMPLLQPACSAKHPFIVIITLLSYIDRRPLRARSIAPVHDLQPKRRLCTITACDKSASIFIIRPIMVIGNFPDTDVTVS